ncbi:uncharacterized protein LOC114245704 [Bombyx mandarina]|uniref:Uncharacterized protein LOC114245704 n=1 Tax=Bombyx mandarina TaxID=7092 RepID=A0A6J2JWI5_BOMMA|nr:uncharacterized protein LOC114245704 [Bombyx mandarina]
MMQQQCHQDQIGNQQGMAQQMVLCPVQVVYETQILVKPGDQIQPNQTIYLNQHNPPPWIKNAQHTQVMYVQHMPSNMMPNIQQSMDQSLYIQNCQMPQQAYQIQQQMLAQNPQETRPIQIQNVQANMLQGFPNMSANIQHDQQIQMTNYNQIPNHVPNRQIVSNNQPINHQTNSPQTLEMQRPVYMNVRTSIPQHSIRQQILIPQNTPNSQHIGQTYIQTHAPQRQIQLNNVQRTMTPTSANITQSPRPTPNTTQNTPTNVLTNINPVISNVRNGNFTFRPIQPRTPYRHNLPNIGALTQPLSHLPNTRPNISGTSSVTAQIVPVSKTLTATTGTQINRKRKAESPDDIPKKTALNPATINENPTKQSSMTAKAISHPNNVSIPSKNVTNPNAVLNKNTPIAKPNDNAPQDTRLQTPDANTALANQTENDKLIRNTVFTQARGRLLNDKEPLQVIEKESRPDNLEEIPRNPAPIKEEDPPKNNFKIPATPEAKKKRNKPPVVIANSDKNSEATDEIKKVEVKTEEGDINAQFRIKREKYQDFQLDKDVKALVRDKIEMKRELESGQRILTHVLDGYVIQESNMAFPIRKPLKERKVYPCTIAPNGLVDNIAIIKSEPVHHVPGDIPLLPYYHMHVNRKPETVEDGENEKDLETKKDNPFEALQQTTVKSWTVHQLSEHLSKHKWNDTISILQEHEMDGESLFLASKTQLTQIGIREEHADFICDFIKS